MLKLAIIYALFAYFPKILATTNNCQQATDGVRGKYTCSLQHATDVTTFTCTALNHECVATKISYAKLINTDTQNTLKFDVQLKMKSYHTEDVQVSVESKSPSPVTKLVDNENMRYVFIRNEKPRIDCETAIRSDDGFTAYQSCDAHLAVATHSVTKNADSADCAITMTQIDAIAADHLFKRKISIKYVNTAKKCKPECTANMEIPVDLTGNNKESIRKTHTFNCDDAIINTIGHDPVSREISFKVDARYQFTKISLSITSGSVEIVEKSVISCAATNSHNDKMKYKILDNSVTTKVFTLQFQVKQVGEILVTTTSKQYTYSLKKEEEFSISCHDKDSTQPEVLGQCEYTCSIVGKSTSVTLKINPSSYRLTNEAVILTKTDGIYKKTNHDITITDPDAKICNEKRMVKVYFEKGGSDHHYYLTHYINCKEPQIVCDKHNFETRIISCTFTIDFQFTSIKLEVQSESVELLISTIDHDPSFASTFQTQIGYKVKDLKEEASNVFQIKFSFLQTGNKLAFVKNLGFEYVKKQEDLPFISCDPNPSAKLISYAAVGYKCKSLASTWDYDLTMETDNFQVSPTKVIGYESGKIYRHDFDIQITPNIIKCNDQKEVTISFKDKQKTYEFTMKHTTSCPAAKFTCDKHDVTNRRITCHVDIIYEYNKIKISSSGSKVTLTITEFTKLGLDTSKNMLSFGYTVNDLTQIDRSFELKFEIMQADENKAEEQAMMFTYILKQNEIPSLVCNENSRGTDNDYHKITYKCTIISKTNSVSIQSDAPTTHDIETTAPGGIAVNQIYKNENHDVTIYPKVIKCEETKQINLYFNDGSEKHEYTVTHKTECPEPQIYCQEHNFKERKLTCHVKVDYPFEKVEILITPSFVSLKSPTDIQPDVTTKTINKNVNIVEYELTDLSQTNRKFQIEFTVKQTGNSYGYKNKLSFEYFLTPNELSKIICKDSGEQDPSKFKQRKYKCDIISREQNVRIKIQSDEYTITNDPLETQEEKKIFKKDNLEITIEVKKVRCGKMEKLMVYFEEGDGSRFTDFVIHQTICPEKPFVNCQMSENQEGIAFHEKVYVCDAMSRQSSMLLTISNSQYRIIKTIGKNQVANSVYKWSNYQIIVKDLQIKCNVDVNLEISFTEYQLRYKSEFLYRTTCPNSVITCEKHDEVNRMVECEVKSKFPHTKVEFAKTGNVDLLAIQNSNIANVDDEWISTHVIPYQVNTLLNPNKQFALRMTVMQDNLEISHHESSFTYLIAENEKPQISCVVDKDMKVNQFATTTYSCYIVSKVDKVTISVIEKGYEVKYTAEDGKQFVDLYRWEDVKVTVTDKEIYCNTTKELTIEVSENGNEKYNSIVEHTTYCNEIIGDCMMQDNVFKYVLCNFTSGLEFQYYNHSCSDSINCTLSNSVNSIPSKSQELIIDLSELTTDMTFEFELNVTLSHSEHSNVTFTYILDHVKTEKLSETGKTASAAVKSETSLTPIIAFLFVLALVLTYKLTRKQIKIQGQQIETPKEYYESL